MYLTPPVLLMASTSELRRCKDKKINWTKKEIFIEISEISTKWLWTRAQRCPPCARLHFSIIWKYLITLQSEKWLSSCLLLPKWLYIIDILIVKSDICFYLFTTLPLPCFYLTTTLWQAFWWVGGSWGKNSLENFGVWLRVSDGLSVCDA